eukprot:3103097-Prymnesium_polylepis.2
MGSGEGVGNVRQPPKIGCDVQHVSETRDAPPAPRAVRGRSGRRLRHRSQPRAVTQQTQCRRPEFTVSYALTPSRHR